MHIRYTFQPDCYRAASSGACVQTLERLDLGPQIAVWLESADRTQFVDTLMVTNMTAARGIGNRPGLWNFLSSPFFPYGKRRMALPIWAHARGKLYDTVVMQDNKEDWLGFHEGHSTSEPYYCRPLMASEIDLDAISCPTRFSSAKGKLDASVKSYYPPRNDLTLFTNNDCDVPGGQLPSCTVSAKSYATLNDLDAVASATPAYGAAYSNTWVIPSALPAGDYALYVEVNKEFDNNASHAHPAVEDGNLPGYGLTNNFGQPSVVYRVPIHIDLAAGAASSATTSLIEGYSDWTGVDGDIIPRDATISTTDAGSGEARLLSIATAAGTGRVHAIVESCGTTGCDPATMNCCDPSKQVCPPPGLQSAAATARAGDRLRAGAGRAGAPWTPRSSSSTRRRTAPPSPATDPVSRGGVDDRRRVPAGDPRAAGRAPGAPGTSPRSRSAGSSPRRNMSPGCAPRTSAGRPRPSSCSRFRRRRGSSSRWRAASSPPPPGGRRWRAASPALRALRDRLRAASGGRRGGHRPLLSVGPRRGRRHPQGPRRRGPWPAGCLAADSGRWRKASSRYNARRCRGTVFLLYAGRPWPPTVAGALEGRAVRVARASPSTSPRPSAPRSRSGSKSADGTFLSTVGADPGGERRGIGNRPGATQMNSGYHWPYGRREGVLPIWAHRRAAAPGRGAVPARHLSESARGWASRTCEDSTPGFLLLPVVHAETRARTAWTPSPARAVQQRQGPHLGRRHAPGTASPRVISGQQRAAARTHLALSAPARLHPVRRRLRPSTRLHGRRRALPGSPRRGDRSPRPRARRCRTSTRSRWPRRRPTSSRR